LGLVIQSLQAGIAVRANLTDVMYFFKLSYNYSLSAMSRDIMLSARPGLTGDILQFRHRLCAHIQVLVVDTYLIRSLPPSLPPSCRSVAQLWNHTVLSHRSIISRVCMYLCVVLIKVWSCKWISYSMHTPQAGAPPPTDMNSVFGSQVSTIHTHSFNSFCFNFLAVKINFLLLKVQLRRYSKDHPVCSTCILKDSIALGTACCSQSRHQTFV